jgi:cyclase
VVTAIDARMRIDKSGWNVVINGGRIDTGLDALEWAKKVEELGAGEILLTSMDADGTKAGYDIKLTDAVAKIVNIPIIASGGCGNLEHFYNIFAQSGADAALAASLFHYRELSIKQVKEYLKERRIEVRL